MIEFFYIPKFPKDEWDVFDCKYFVAMNASPFPLADDFGFDLLFVPAFSKQACHKPNDDVMYFVNCMTAF